MPNEVFFDDQPTRRKPVGFGACLNVWVIASAVVAWANDASAWGIEQKLEPPEPHWLQQGMSVALLRDTAVLGVEAPNGLDRPGSVCVYQRTGATWALQQKLASGGTADDHFGAAVAISDGLIVVGAPGIDAIYVFAPSTTAWMEQQELAPSDVVPAGARFGSSIAIVGDTMLVGAPGWSVGSTQNHMGAAYVFTRVGSSWTEQQKITANDGLMEDQFGAAVALSGDTALVGTRRGTPTVAGAAYVFVRSDGLQFAPQQQLVSPIGPTHDDSFNDLFGWALALDGNVAFLGAPGILVNRAENIGATYVWTRVGTTTWALQQKLATQAAYLDGFGGSIAIEDNLALISAMREGALYLFSSSAGGWEQMVKLTAAGSTMSGQFGAPIALSADEALVAAPSDDAAYILRRDISSGGPDAASSDAQAAQAAGCSCRTTPVGAESVGAGGWLVLAYLIRWRRGSGLERAAIASIALWPVRTQARAPRTPGSPIAKGVGAWHPRCIAAKG